MLFPQDKYGMKYKEVSKHDLAFFGNDFVSSGTDFLTHGNEIVACDNNLFKKR